MAGFKLLRQVFLPAPKQLKLSPVIEAQNKFQLKFFRHSDEDRIPDKFAGYTLVEAAQAVANVFNSIGMKQF